MRKVINQVGRKYLLIAILAGVVQFVCFKILYPFPDFISDSASYISTNQAHMAVNLWPVGYSIFLNVVHGISSSHYFLVWCQYLILLFSLLYFFYTVLYIFNLKPLNRVLLFIFLFFNPVFLYLANCVLSDAIFYAVSIILFSQYIWMLHRPAFGNLLLQAVLIGLAFVIRYTAIYYPMVSIFAILMAHYTPRVRLAGIVLPWLFILSFIQYTQTKTKELTGTAEFSVFGGWQLANNALYMYGHIQVDSTALPEEFRGIDSTARAYFREKAPTEDDITEIQGTYFIKKQDAILKPYMKAYIQTHPLHRDGTEGSFEAWGSVSPVYKAYGRYLILHHPGAFAQYYLWLNTQNYFVPYLEKFSNYNLGMPTMFGQPAAWFELQDATVYTQANVGLQAMFFSLYPIFFMLLNIYFFICLVDFIVSGKIRYWRELPASAIVVATIFLAANFAFSVFATPVVMRYQLLPMTLLFFCCLYMTQQLQVKAKDLKPAKKVLPLQPSQAR